MKLPSGVGSYRIIRQSELTEEQLQILRRAGRKRVLERLCILVGEGKVSMSRVQARYGALMSEVGDA